jgi:hypothetical protein
VLSKIFLKSNEIIVRISALATKMGQILFSSEKGINMGLENLSKRINVGGHHNFVLRLSDL